MAEAAEPVVVDQPATGGYATVTQDGFEVSSNTETETEIRESLTPPAKVEPPVEGETAERNADGTFKAKVAKPRNDPQARIDQVVREREDARREAAALKAELAAARASRVDKPEAPRQVTPPAEDPEPQEGQFEDYRQFVKAQARWEARQELNEREAKRNETTTRQQQEHETRTLNEAWSARLDDARAKDPDRIAAINPDTPMCAPMMHIIKESPLGVELLTYLSDHQDVAQRISTLHPVLVFREMGKLEARLEAASSGPVSVVPNVSKAKAPIKPLGTAPLATHDEPGDDASDDDWLRQERAKARRR